MKYVFLHGIVYDSEYQSGKLMASTPLYAALYTFYRRALTLQLLTVLELNVDFIHVLETTKSEAYKFTEKMCENILLSLVYYLSPQLTN